MLDTRIVLFGDISGDFFQEQMQGEKDTLFQLSFTLTNVICSPLRVSGRSNPQLVNHFAIVVYFSSKSLCLL